MSKIYFGGSRNLQSHPAVVPVVSAVVSAGHRVHVGCQTGADKLVTAFCDPAHLSIFAVSSWAETSLTIKTKGSLGAVLHLWAGGPASVPFGARLLRRSIAAFQGCAAAVFFEPGPGSFAVMREYIKQYPTAPVFVFAQTQPIPRFSGHFQYVLNPFVSLACWQFIPQATPAQLF